MSIYNSREEIMTAIDEFGGYEALKQASDELRADHDVVMAAVSTFNGDDCSYNVALQYASKELRADREIVLAAVSNCGRALDYASDELKQDPELIKLTNTDNSDF